MFHALFPGLLIVHPSQSLVSDSCLHAHSLIAHHTFKIQHVTLSLLSLYNKETLYSGANTKAPLTLCYMTCKFRDCSLFMPKGGGGGGVFLGGGGKNF